MPYCILILYYLITQPRPDLLIVRRMHSCTAHCTTVPPTHSDSVLACGLLSSKLVCYMWFGKSIIGSNYLVGGTYNDIILHMKQRLINKLSTIHCICNLPQILHFYIYFVILLLWTVYCSCWWFAASSFWRVINDIFRWKSRSGKVQRVSLQCRKWMHFS